MTLFDLISNPDSYEYNAELGGYVPKTVDPILEVCFEKTMAIAKKLGTYVYFNDRINCRAYYDWKLDIVTISSKLSKIEQLSSLLHELGHKAHCQLFGDPEKVETSLYECIADRFCLIWFSKFGLESTEWREKHYQSNLIMIEEEDEESIDITIEMIFESLNESIPEDF